MRDQLAPLAIKPDKELLIKYMDEYSVLLFVSNLFRVREEIVNQRSLVGAVSIIDFFHEAMK